MRVLVLAAAFLALCATAQAQTGWTAPSGQFSLSFPRSWGVIPPPANDPPQVLAHFGQTTTLVERKECYIDVMPTPAYAGLDQAAINAAASAWTERDAREVLGFGALPDLAVESFENAAVDGVPVATLHWTLVRNGNETRVRQRVFVLTQGGIAQRFGIHCLVLDRGAHTNDVDALLNSLRFAVTP